jgi:hypothetical protein
MGFAVQRLAKPCKMASWVRSVRMNLKNLHGLDTYVTGGESMNYSTEQHNVLMKAIQAVLDSSE